MDRSPVEVSSEPVELPTGSAVRPGIEARPGRAFAVVTEAEPADPISRTLALGIFPPLCRPIVEVAEMIVPEGGRILDLGGHVGTFALAMAAGGRRVVAVEASPRNASLLDASVRVNRFESERLRLVHAAVSDRPGTLRFFPSGPFGQVDTTGVRPGAVDVPAVAGDDLLERVGWDRVDFIKMDIEGSEIAGLLGLSNLLNRPDAPPILVESNGHTLHPFGETPSSLKATLVAFGYQVFQVEDRRLIPVEIGEYQGTTVVDYLAIKRHLPVGRRWRYDAPMPARERIRRARATCLSPQAEERHYAARTIGQAPEAVRTDRRVVRAVEALKRDAVAEVRQAAAAWSFTPRPEPWYAFWRR